MTRQATFGAVSIALGVIVAAAALILLASAALAAGAVSVSDAEAQPGDTATVYLEATAGEGSGIGNWTIEVSWDPLADAIAGDPVCTSNPAGSCEVNPGGQSGVARFAGATGDPDGLTEDVALGALTFFVGDTPGDCTALEISVERLDDQDGAPVSVSGSVDDGEVCVASEETATPVLTASPAPSGTAGPTAAPTASPTRTATPAAVPTTGGDAGAGAGSVTLLLLAAGLAMAAGGAWAVARARHI